MKKIQHIIIGIALVLFSVFTNAQTIYTVTKTTDPDPFEHPYNFIDSLCDPEMYGTLQWAVRKVNETYGPRIINFNIPGAGPHTILLNDYLPQITKDVIIDGTSQPGYTEENPAITIDGQYLMAWCFNTYGLNSLEISGFNFIGFVKNGISLVNCRNTIIKSNNIALKNSYYNIQMKFYFARISIYNCENISLYNNELNTIFEGITTPGPKNYGIMLTNSTNCNIGSTEQNFANKIYDCYTGVYLDSCQNIKISANEIYNNLDGILLEYGSNNSKKKPMIISYDEGIISGVAEIGDIIEVFGGTGEEDANEFLGTVQADQYGDWTLTATTNFEYLIATATDQNNNTSMYSDEILVSPTCTKPTNLSSTEGVSTSHTLTWEGQEGVTYNVAVGIKELSPIYENWIVSYNQNITDNQITITDLDENTEYEFYVNANCGTEVSHWAGGYVFNQLSDSINNGSTCERAIFLNPDNYLYYTESTITEQEKWFKFIAQADTCGVFISPDISSQNHITDISIFEGSCDNILLLSNSTYSDSLNIWMTNLIEGHEYFIKVNNQNEDSIEFTLGLYFRKNVIRFNCPVECPNLIRNGDFEDLSSNMNTTCPFNSSQGDVCGWRTAFGSPQILYSAPYDYSNQHYAYMWLGSNSSSSGGEGIFQNVEICEGETYTFSFRYKALSNSIYPVGFDLRILFTDSNTFNINENDEGGVSLPDFSDFNNDNYQIVANQTLSTAGFYGDTTTTWIYQDFTFTADADYSRLLIYPINAQQSGINCFRIDKISLIRINTDAGEDQSICIGESTQLEPADCHPTYTWSSTPPGFSSNQSNPIVSPIVNTTYNLTITDENGCTATDYTVVNVDNQPDATIDTVAPMCIHDYSIYLSAAAMGIGSYWSGNGIVDNISGLFDPSVAGVGTHTIFYSIVNGACSDSATTTIVVLPMPDITASNDGPVCEGFPVNFTSSSTFEIDEYQWYGPGGTLDTIPDFTIPNAQINHAGNYMVTVTDFNGCTNEAETTLEVYSNPIVNITPPNPAICNGEPIILSAQGQGQINGYEWSTGETTPTISVNQGNTSYSVTVTDDNGCSGADTIYVTESNIEIDLMFSTNTCENSNEGTISVQVTGGSEPYTYDWTGPGSFSANTSTITNLYPGQYNLTVTDNSQCSETETYIIDELEIPELEITDDIICTGTNDGVITVTVTNMDGPFTYLWSGGQDTETIINQPAGNYSVTVTAANECSATISTHIDNYPVPEVTITPSETIICNMVPITLDAGDGWYSYDWSTGDSTQIIEVHTPDADYSVTITDIHGCVGIDTIHIGGSNLAIKDAVVVHTCEGQNDGSISQTIVGGDEPLVFEWTGPDGFTADTEDISNLFAGEYYFTVTDANGCFLTEVYIVEDFENPDLTISSDYVCNSENTGSLEVSVTNLPGPFDVLWSNNETTFIIVNQTPGEYTVTVTDIQSGCSASISSLIDNYIVDASFSLNDDCLDLDRIGIQWYFNLHFDFEYTAIDWQNYDFYWDLGNGTIGTELTVPVDYALDGYYCVTATVSREECFSTVSDIVYVYPNRCYCIETEWDTEFYTDYTLQETDEFWGGIFRRIRGQIIVPNGHTLTLHKCDLIFGTNGGITVEQGGTLIVSQTKMTSKGMGSCDGMWQGIEVHGQWGLPVEQQGNVRFINGGNIIENAHIGILLGERNVDYVCNPQINPELGPFNTAGSCGWVKADDVDFINNGTDIRFVKPIENYQYNNPSAINNCDFTSSILIDECYNSSHLSHYGNSVSLYGDPIPANTRNPWAGGSNPTQRSAQGFWMQNHRFNSSFDFDTLINKEICVETYDSKYNVTHSYFNTAKYGIRIYNTLSTANNAHKIYQNTFDNIPGIVASSGAHIFIGGGILDRIRDNTFGSPLTIQDYTNTGIYTRGASRFIIEENEFNRLWTAVFIGSSGNQSSDVRAGISDVHDDWRGNNFYQCRTNIYTRGTNARLRLRCNNCKNDDPNNYYVNFHNQGHLANQGTYLSSAPPQQYWGAGNEFFDQEDFPSEQSRYIKSDYAYRYVYHSNLKTTPEIYPGSVLNTQPLGLSKAVNSVSCFTFSLPFPLPFPFPFIPAVPGTGIPDIEDILPILPDVLNEIDYLEQVRINLKNSEDGGKTEQLLNDISNHIPNGKLKNKLISNSPLSDTVITALLIEYPLSHGNFKSVMVKNMPVSPAVEPYLFARLETIPQGIRQQLKPLQSFNPDANTVSSITRYIDYLTQERELVVNEILMTFTDTAYYNPEYIKQILAAENDPQFDMNLAAFLIGEGNYTEAMQIIDNIEPVNKETSEWIEYHQILLSLYQDNKTIYQMDSMQMAFITDLAYACPGNYTTANAQAVLHLLYGTEFEECEEMVNRRSFSLVKDVVFAVPETNAWIEDNFPNPFADETLINYYLPDESKGSVVVSDMYGREISSYRLTHGENTLIIKSVDWAPGVYSYSFIVDGKSLEHKKMIITQ